MGMTITEKILAAHAGKSSARPRGVKPGDSLWCDIDLLMTHDVCGPASIGIFHQQFGPDAKVFDPAKVVIIPDHYIFTADGRCHRNVDILRSFVKEQGIESYYDPDFLPPGLPDGQMPPPYSSPGETSYCGVCHAAMPQNGHVCPGELMVGTDSHTCTHGAFGQFATGIGNTEAAFVLGTGKLWLKVPPTLRFVLDGQLPAYVMAKDFILHVIGKIGVDGATYCAMEFAGEAIDGINVDERMTICNMAIEAGAKNGIIVADDITSQYVRDRSEKDFDVVASDSDADYAKSMSFDAASLEPTVACPHSPGLSALARELGDVKIDRAYIGSCTGGKTTDLIAAAMVLAGRTVAVDTFIVPATTETDRDLDSCIVAGKSLRDVFLAAGCKIGPAGCGACLGGPVDTFGRVNEPMTVISTTNRNFPGRMGCKEAAVYLASPLTAAASAVAGKIADPRDYIQSTTTVGAAR